MKETILDFDKSLFLIMNFNGGDFLNEFFYLASGKLIWVPLYLFILYLLVRSIGFKTTLLSVVFIVITVVAADQLCNFFKGRLPKVRPTHNPEFEGLINIIHYYRGGKSGTVSAHAAISFGIATISALLLRRRKYTVCIYVWATVVAYSRIYLGVHYPLDIFFGLLNGTILGSCCYFLFRYTFRLVNKTRSVIGTVSLGDRQPDLS